VNVVNILLKTVVFRQTVLMFSLVKTGSLVLCFFFNALMVGWVCERADQDILVDMEMSSYTSAWHLPSDVRDWKTAFVWKEVPSGFIIAVIAMKIPYPINLSVRSTRHYRDMQIRKNMKSVCACLFFSCTTCIRCGPG
jgi:uncharacterized membrane protein SpoIIM required for sporulation